MFQCLIDGVQGKKTQMIRLCLIFNITIYNQVGITIIWYKFVKQLLNFVESAVVLNEF